MANRPNRPGLGDGTSSFGSGRSTNNPNEREPIRQRVIVFVAGGMTYSEMRTAYQVGSKLNKDVYIGEFVFTVGYSFYFILSVNDRYVFFFCFHPVVFLATYRGEIYPSDCSRRRVHEGSLRT